MSENAAGFNGEGGSMPDWQTEIIRKLDPQRPVLIAGPTASGKSGLALGIAESQGGRIINADALQVYSDWRILTARPGPDDLARAEHALYGHVPGDQPYSVGDWLRDIRPLLSGPRPIVVGGTGLYFTAMTEGLAEIPTIPAGIRARAEAELRDAGLQSLLDELDAQTRARIDIRNPMRVQRAWEVQQATGRGLAAWQDDPARAVLPLDRAEAVVLEADPGWLEQRIAARFDLMVRQGVVEETRKNRAAWRSDLPSAKAIGAAELMAHLDGDLTLADVKERVVILTRQYAKRQRSWFRGRMGAWNWHACH